MKPYVFLSFAHEDVVLANGVEASLKRVGFEVWRFDRYMAPGYYSKDKIEAAIADADACVFLLTASGVKSPWVNQEIGIASGLRKVIVPVVERGIPLGELGVLIGTDLISFDPENVEYTLACVARYFEQMMENKRSRSKVFGAVALAVAAFFLLPLLGEAFAKNRAAGAEGQKDGPLAEAPQAEDKLRATKA